MEVETIWEFDLGIPWQPSLEAILAGKKGTSNFVENMTNGIITERKQQPPVLVDPFQ